MVTTQCMLRATPIGLLLEASKTDLKARDKKKSYVEAPTKKKALKFERSAQITLLALI